MSSQKDCFPQFIATDDPSDLDPVTELTFRNMAISRRGIPYAAITDTSGFPVTTLFLDDQIATDEETGLVTASVMFALRPDFAQADKVNCNFPFNDNIPTAFTALSVCGFTYGFDGTAYDRVRTASAANQSAATKTAPMQVATPGTWGIVHTPAENTRATISRAAGAAGVRHVCTSVSAVLIADVAAISATVQLNLRDGATGAGTIIKSWTLMVGGAASTVVDRAIIDLSGLQLVGTAATAMTLEFSAAGGASTFESVSLEGYDIA